MIPAGQTSATVSVVGIHDYITEGNEIVEFSLVDGRGYNLGTEINGSVTVEERQTTSQYGSFVYVNPENGHLYILSEPDTWFGAQGQAEALGGNLVAINDVNEGQWLLDIFGNLPTWMGLTDSEIYGASEGQYQWVNGEAVNYSNWGAGQPDNALGNEDFSILNAPFAGQWNDRNYLGNFRGIIEIDPATLTTPIVNLMVTDNHSQ